MIGHYHCASISTIEFMKPDPQKLHHLVESHEKPKRLPLSSLFPCLRRPIIFVRIISKKLKNRLLDVATERNNNFYKNVMARHQSVLMRKLGDSELELQKNKIINLKRACESLNGLIVEPGQVFSMWEILGKPDYRKGYVEGMLLSNGKIIRGIGGGLCQLSNFLCWIFLHADIKIIERYHHSMDVFPDSGRVLPFGSGATCLYNFVDFQVKNMSDQSIQLKIWITEKHLKGQLLSPHKGENFKFHIIEKNHCFIKNGQKYYRYNEIYRIRKSYGKTISEELLFTNFAPVLYEITPQYLLKNNFNVIDLE